MEHASYFVVVQSRAEFDQMVIAYLTYQAERGDKLIHARREWMLDGDYPVETTTKRAIKKDFEGYDVRIYEVGAKYHVYSCPKDAPQKVTGISVKPRAQKPIRKPRPVRDPFLDVHIPDAVL